MHEYNHWSNSEEQAKRFNSLKEKFISLGVDEKELNELLEFAYRAGEFDEAYNNEDFS